MRGHPLERPLFWCKRGGLTKEVPLACTPKFPLVLLPNNVGHSRKYNIALYFYTCLSNIGYKYMLVLIEILHVPESIVSWDQW